MVAQSVFAAFLQKEVVMIFNRFWMHLCRIGIAVRRAWAWLGCAGMCAQGRIALLGLALCFASSANAEVYRVKAGATSNGPGTDPDWSDAFNNLQDAWATHCC